jgi:hypothetical protein
VNRRSRQNKYPAKTQHTKASSRLPFFSTGAGAINQQMLLPLSDPTFTVVQSFEAVGSTTSSTTNPTFTAGYVTLAAFDQDASFKALFDQYRIEMVEYTFVPQTSEGYSGTNSGLFTVVIDYDDATALSSVASALDYPNQQTVRGLDPVKVVWKPKIAMAAYNGAFTGYANAGNQWLDIASDTIQHYGVKTAWTVTGAAYSYNIIARALLQFRRVR